MGTYRDDLQAATARAEAAEKALADQQALIDRRVRRIFVRAIVACGLAVAFVFGIVRIAAVIREWSADREVESTAVVECGPGGNGGNMSIEAGEGGKGCGVFPDGQPGDILIGTGVASAIYVGHPGSPIVINGDVVFNGRVRFAPDGGLPTGGPGGTLLLRGGTP